MNQAVYVDHLEAVSQKSRQIADAAAAGEWEHLVLCLDERLALMKQIDLLSDSERQMDYQSALRAADLLAQIEDLDKGTSAQVSAALEATRAALEESRLARTTVSAYRTAAQPVGRGPAARFIDAEK